MSKVCPITGKRPQTGHNRSHSMRATKRRFMPNLQKKRVFDPATGRWVKMRISTAAIRNLTKKGLV